MGTDIVIFCGRAAPPGKRAASAPDATSGSAYEDVPGHPAGMLPGAACHRGTGRLPPDAQPASTPACSPRTASCPIYQQIRSMNLAGGRLISEADMREARAVCVIGDEVKKQLFAGARGGRRPGLHRRRAVHGHRRAGQEGPEQLLQRVGRQQGADPLHRDGPAFPGPAAVHRPRPHRQHPLHARLGGRPLRGREAGAAVAGPAPRVRPGGRRRRLVLGYGADRPRW